MFGKIIRKIINSSDGFKKFICPYSGLSYILQVEDLNYVDFKFVNGDFQLITFENNEFVISELLSEAEFNSGKILILCSHTMYESSLEKSFEDMMLHFSSLPYIENLTSKKWFLVKAKKFISFEMNFRFDESPHNFNVINKYYFYDVGVAIMQIVLIDQSMVKLLSSKENTFDIIATSIH